MTTNREAVEALAIAFTYSNSTDNFVTDAERIKAETFWAKFFIRNAERIKTHLERQGFTITRQPAMTDAELLKAATSLAYRFVSQTELADECCHEIEMLAKKYRG